MRNEMGALSLDDQGGDGPALDLKKLPDDCLLHIFEYFTPDERLQLRQVCQHWCQLLDGLSRRLEAKERRRRHYHALPEAPSEDDEDYVDDGYDYGDVDYGCGNGNYYAFDDELSDDDHYDDYGSLADDNEWLNDEHENGEHNLDAHNDNDGGVGRRNAEEENDEHGPVEDGLRPVLNDDPYDDTEPDDDWN